MARRAAAEARLLLSRDSQVRQLTKWPVKEWVQACIYAADEADFVIVLQSSNYDEGHYCTAERFLVKESNVPHVVVVLDKEAHVHYSATPADALANLKGRATEP